ncbi:MAG: 2-oxoacid:acceptor oxidoreductase family protein, partial [Deltaproteobacteria bacterium]|nr:2-oxoacid:acceptor oxidoreductase family protein [Deltaproteobacteria bacterium]
MNRPRIVSLPEHIVEIVSDAGEGAQKAAVAFARLCAKTGNGLWTVEIIPSEIRPPPHTIGSASGNRIRLAERSQVTNAGDLADVVLAFNEMALLSRLEAGSLADDVLVLIDDQWATHDVEEYRLSYREVLDKFRTREDAEQGKNMFAVGLLCALYSKNVNLLKNVIRGIFEKKTREVIETAVKLAGAGYEYGIAHLEERFEIQAVPTDVSKVAMNGNTALALGAVSAGFEMCSMYPITPATSASHEL